ncbi:MAG: response regulator transcription factor [Clostridia bacterium]|jgi:DNA-binding response OmpR family regulator|nr:response regulator transcription factor [Clostridia bacterium]MBR0436922.1 response regulator transcription factor [Clostridia bacterium]MBR3038857.1 response regulator transcription factor [Clostridia bacterium]
MKNRILVVEDDAAIRDAVLLNLQFAGYETRAFEDGADAANALEDDHAFDLALLDIMLPGMDGFELFSVMEHYGIPVIYMTAKTDSASEIKGLRDGAEDYIVKPFDPLTLMVRIEKVLKRIGKWNAVFRVRDVVVNIETHTVTKGGEPVVLQPLEFDVLVMLLRHKNMTVSRERLLNEVWGFDYLGETRMVDVKISALRKKLDLEDAIRAIPKLGYRLEDR